MKIYENYYDRIVLLEEFSLGYFLKLSKISSRSIWVLCASAKADGNIQRTVRQTTNNAHFCKIFCNILFLSL